MLPITKFSDAMDSVNTGMETDQKAFDTSKMPLVLTIKMQR